MKSNLYGCTIFQTTNNPSCKLGPKQTVISYITILQFVVKTTRGQENLHHYIHLKLTDKLPKENCLYKMNLQRC